MPALNEHVTINLIDDEDVGPVWLIEIDDAEQEGYEHLDDAVRAAARWVGLYIPEAADEVYRRGEELYVRLGRYCVAARSQGGDDYTLCDTTEAAHELFAQWVKGTDECFAETACYIAEETAR